MSIIWDDSALINAFNASLAKYRAMHGLLDNSTRAVSKSYRDDGENNEEASKAENGESISAKDTCEACVSQDAHPGDSPAMCVDKPPVYPDLKQYKHHPSHSGNDISSKDVESKEELRFKLELLEQQHQQLQDYVSQLYSFMNAREYSDANLSGYPQPPTHSSGSPYQAPYGSFFQHHPHYHWGLLPHPHCLWHSHHPISTTAPCSQPPLSHLRDPVHVSAETLHNPFPAQAQSSSISTFSSEHVVAEVLRDTLYKSLSSCPEVSAHTSIGGNSAEEGRRLSELLTVWFNAGLQTARYLQEQRRSPG